MNICMPVYDDVDMLDVTGPFEMFSWANIKVDLVTQKPGPIRFAMASASTCPTVSIPPVPAMRFGCPAAIRLHSRP
jgi:putative intracellular protease/amidase